MFWSKTKENFLFRQGGVGEGYGNPRIIFFSTSCAKFFFCHPLGIPMHVGNIGMCESHVFLFKGISYHGSNPFGQNTKRPNPEWDHRFGSVRDGSGSNHGSELNFGSTMGTPWPVRWTRCTKNSWDCWIWLPLAVGSWQTPPLQSPASGSGCISNFWWHHTGLHQRLRRTRGSWVMHK